MSHDERLIRETACTLYVIEDQTINEVSVVLVVYVYTEIKKYLIFQFYT